MIPQTKSSPSVFPAVHPRAATRVWAVPLALLLLLWTAEVRQSSGQDTASTQVRIEARILEWRITNGMDFDFAVRYQRDPGSSSILDSADLTLPADPSLGSAARIFFDDIDVGPGSFEAVIEALETVGEVSILSQPSIILNSQQVDPDQINISNTNTESFVAKLSNTVRIPYETTESLGTILASVTKYRDSGVALDVNVVHIQDNLVVLDYWASVTDLSGFINIGLNPQNQPMRVPTIDSRSLLNRVIVVDRQIFIAGLIKTTRESDRRRGIPWISELPFMRWLLTSKKQSFEDTELVFLIRPEILTTTPPMPISSEDAQ